MVLIGMLLHGTYVCRHIVRHLRVWDHSGMAPHYGEAIQLNSLKRYIRLGGES